MTLFLTESSYFCTISSIFFPIPSGARSFCMNGVRHRGEDACGPGDAVASGSSQSPDKDAARPNGLFASRAPGDEPFASPAGSYVLGRLPPFSEQRCFSDKNDIGEALSSGQTSSPRIFRLISSTVSLLSPFGFSLGRYLASRRSMASRKAATSLISPDASL